MAPGLYLSNLPKNTTEEVLKKALIEQFPEMREAANCNQLKVVVYLPKTSGKAKGNVVATASGFQFNYVNIVNKATGFQISNTPIRVKYDKGDDRNEYGEFINKISPAALREYHCLMGETSRRVKFVFTDEFLQLLNPQVYSCKRNVIHGYLGALPQEELERAGHLVNKKRINKEKRYFMLTYGSVLECIQAISLLNGETTASGKVSFVQHGSFLPSTMERRCGIGQNGSCISVKDVANGYGFIPFTEVDFTILRDLSSINGYCWRCGELYKLIGFSNDLTFVAGKCSCSYDSGLSVMCKNRAFFWNEDYFTRLVPATMDANEVPRELIICYQRMKTFYSDMAEYHRIVGPILYEEWKFFSTNFKTMHQIDNGHLDAFELIEEVSTETGETRLVYHMELVVPLSERKFWNINNRLEIKQLTLRLKVLDTKSGRQLTQTKKTKARRYFTDADGSLRMYCRLEVHNSMSVFPQGKVQVTPKPDKTAYRSTINVLNKLAKVTDEGPFLKTFLGHPGTSLECGEIIRKSAGKMRMFISRQKNKLNAEQEIAYKVAKSSKISVLQGPPGTGKTFAASVYALMFGATEEGRILACCPTNYAADVLAESIVRRTREGPCNIRVLRVYAKGQEAAMLDAKLPDVKRFTKLHDAVRNHRQWLCGTTDDWNIIKRAIVSGREHLLKERHIKMLDNHVACLEEEILSQHEIIVSTVDSLADHRVLGSLKLHPITTLIIDEAAQLKQPCFPFLFNFSPKRILLIGDHLQLRPQIDSFAAASAGLDKSLMEWFMLSEKIPSTMLTQQHRMTPSICALVSDLIYDGKLTTATITTNRTNPFSSLAIPEGGQDVIVFDHIQMETKDGTSWRNEGEAKMIQAFTEDVLSKGARMDDITVITLYESQNALLKSMLPKGIQIVNCDAYQGKENKMIILSLTRCNKQGNIGFVSSTNRLNVALSRAMFKIVIFCNLETFKKRSNNVWTNFCNKILQYGVVVEQNY